MMMEKREKISSFDALRVYSCFVVMAYHAFLVVPGYSGLSIFFVMSGFLCTYNHFGDGETSKLDLRGSLRFSLDKIKKLYPLHLVMLIYPLATQLYGLVNGLLPAWRFITKLAANVLLIHAWIPVNEYYFSFNVPTWYLSVMMFLYFMLPFVLRCMEKYRSRRTALLAAVAIFLVQGVSADLLEQAYVVLLPESLQTGLFYQWLDQVCPLYRLGDFAIGCNVAYFFIHRGERDISRPRATLLELAAILFIALSQISYDLRPRNITCVFIPSSAFIVYVFALDRGYISGFLKNKLVKHLSALSSDIYLIHYPVIMVSSFISTSLPLAAGAQKAFFLCFAFGGTYVLALLWRAARKKHRKAALKG